MSDPESTPIARSRDVLGASIALAIAAAAGVAGALCSVAPTGSRGTDVVVTFTVAAFVAWAAASAPWWSITAAALIATVGTAFGPWMVPALLALGIGVFIRVSSASLWWLNIIAVGLVTVSLFNLRINPFLGASALIAGVVLLTLAIIGVIWREPPVRARAMWVMIGTAVIAVLAAAGMGFGALQAQDKLVLGNRLLTQGFDQLRTGDTTRAADTLARAAKDLHDAAQQLDSNWTQAARFLPVVAQHRAIATDIVSKAAVSAAAAANALAAADIDQLRLVSGRVDVATLGALAKPFADLDRAVRDLSAAFASGHSPWLINAVRTELGKAQPDIDAALTQTDAIAALAAHGPVMLGTDGTRRYLVAFTSPGRARGQGGVVDDYAEISIIDGKIEQTASGRSEDLIAELAKAAPFHLQASDEYFERYGAFGAGSASKAVDPAFWSSATMDPDTPTVADVLSQMYAAAGHGNVDGVIIIDPVGLASLLEVAGPIDVAFGDPPVSQHVNATRLRQFLLLDQYDLVDADRRVVIEAVAGAALKQFLDAALPAPQELGAALGPPATEGHIAWWARRPDEQAVIQLIGMSARLPSPDGGDGLAIVSNNAADNALDAFLERTITYTATYDPATGEVTGELVVTLHNRAPASGYDAYVIGNSLGLPSGTNRTALSVYSPLTAGAVTVDDLAVKSKPSTEMGWNVSTVEIDLAPGQTRTLHMTLVGTISTDGYRLVWRPQPLTSADTFDLDVTGAGQPITFSGRLVRTSVIDADGIRAQR
jgi:Protein of unknown function (DUF4012)